jgi:hypothetical protein
MQISPYPPILRRLPLAWVITLSPALSCACVVIEKINAQAIIDRIFSYMVIVFEFGCKGTGFVAFAQYPKIVILG